MAPSMSWRQQCGKNLDHPAPATLYLRDDEGDFVDWIETELPAKGIISVKAVKDTGINLSDQRQFKEQPKQELKQELELLPALKRSRTGWQEYSTLPTQDCNEVKLWNADF